MNFVFFPKEHRAQVMTVSPTGAVIWYKGMPHHDLLTFDAAGYKVLSNSLGGSARLTQDVISMNIKLFLNDFLSQTPRDFHRDGPIRITEAVAKHLLGIPA